jgi:hypothetical protein
MEEFKTVLVVEMATARHLPSAWRKVKYWDASCEFKRFEIQFEGDFEVDWRHTFHSLESSFRDSSNINTSTSSSQNKRLWCVMCDVGWLCWCGELFAEKKRLVRAKSAHQKTSGPRNLQFCPHFGRKNEVPRCCVFRITLMWNFQTSQCFLSDVL